MPFQYFKMPDLLLLFYFLFLNITINNPHITVNKLLKFAQKIYFKKSNYLLMFVTLNYQISV